MKTKIITAFILTISLFSVLFGCSDRPLISEQTDTACLPVTSAEQVSEASKITEEETKTSAEEIPFRVLSFNIRVDLYPKTGMIGALSMNRIQAVRELILSYEPDVFGLQEDGNRWIREQMYNE